MDRNPKVCNVAVCDRDSSVRGMCMGHYRRWKRGKPIDVALREATPTGLSVEQRFWRHVDIRDPEECWEWTGQRMPKGYGIFDGTTRGQLAHRLTYAWHYGVDVSDTCILHRCDNPPCVNPAHLFTGTREDNIADKVAKGRQVKGSRVTGSKLIESDVIAIRSDARSNRTIAQEYGVDAASISRIKSRKNWKWVP